MSDAVGPPRRALLLGGSVALLTAACTRQTASPARPAPEPVDPDDALRSAAVEREQALLREYDAVLAALPELSARLLPLRLQHAEHLDVLTGPVPTASASPSASASARASGAPAVPAVPPPGDAAAALVRLAAAERTAGDLHAADCLAASRSLAPVLASLSASELSHPVALA